MEKKLRILMMIHRQADNSPYCFYVHEQAKALMARGHEVVVISAVGVTPMMKRLRPGQAEVAARTPKEAVVDGVRVIYPRYLTLGNAGERLLGKLSDKARIILTVAVAVGMVFLTVYMYTTYG